MQTHNNTKTFFYRTAGTVGAVVTCPLEVVKTRLQSSSAFPQPSRISEGPASINASSEALLRPEQRRKLCTTILRKGPQPQVIGGVRRVVLSAMHFRFHVHFIIDVFFKALDDSQQLLLIL